MIPRIDAVSFLNTIPLVEWFRQCEGPAVKLTFALPSVVSDHLSGDIADVALVPVADVLAGRTAGIISDACIASPGPVDSVKMFVSGDPGEIRRVIADRGSRSSIALLRVLLAERFGLRPEIRVQKPPVGTAPERGDAVLVIGDLCFAYEKSLPTDSDVRIVDLAEAWRDLTGLPFVFAVWAAAPGFPDRAGAAEVARIGRMLGQARDYGLQHASELAARAAAAGHLGPGGEATAAAIDYYFRTSLRYTLGDAEFAGIRRFQELSIRHGVLPAGEAPVVL